MFSLVILHLLYFLQLTDREKYLEQMIEEKNARILELKRRIMSTNSPSAKATAKREALQLLKQKKLFIASYLIIKLHSTSSYLVMKTN